MVHSRSLGPTPFGAEHPGNRLPRTAPDGSQDRSPSSAPLTWVTGCTTPEEVVMSQSLPVRAPGASGRQHTVPEPQASPSLALRARAESGWARFLRRGGSDREESEQ
ncbi:hypothetical protein [Streptomyces sp. A1547]|uniref:hypothetical protein n=1 Tax=Streptomyces sp. A1547 TaxID=2563105 RepID=UPI00109EDBBE|nr:hypothetical protein [Streptomyces sp. A1547]THA37798.1 hypothetical protein E6W17_19715 [Streptomyces sp. A1547]